MNGNIRNRSAARTKSEMHFAASEKRALSFKAEQEKELTEMRAKNQRLRTLRLAKEAQDREVAAKLAEEAAAAEAARIASGGHKKPRARIKKS